MSVRRDAGDGVAILGGGPAGLATAWALEALDCPYTLLEAAPAPGGNARTLRFGDFRYDTGPHRFHDRDPGATRRVVELLGDDLREIEAPSRIFWNGAFVVRYQTGPRLPAVTSLMTSALGLALRSGTSHSITVAPFVTRF